MVISCSTCNKLNDEVAPIVRMRLATSSTRLVHVDIQHHPIQLCMFTAQAMSAVLVQKKVIKQSNVSCSYYCRPSRSLHNQGSLANSLPKSANVLNSSMHRTVQCDDTDLI
jgi:hypothetical protein